MLTNTQSAIETRDRLLGLFGAARGLNEILRGDLGIGSAHFQGMIRKTMNRTDGYRLTLAEFKALDEQATALAEKINKGIAWITEAEAKLTFHARDERAALSARIEANTDRVREWGKELVGLEKQQVECWTH